MSERHLQFDHDAVPASERKNPAASTGFDWDEVFAACDGELVEATADLDLEERQRLAVALARLLSWMFAASTYRGRSKTLDAAIGRRAVALGLHVGIFPAPSQADAARRLGISRQALNQAAQLAKARFPVQ